MQAVDPDAVWYVFFNSIKDDIISWRIQGYASMVISIRFLES